MGDEKELRVMQDFSLKNIPDLDVCVLGALEFLSNSKIPKIDIRFKKPLVAGSGNAETTGRIIFSDREAIFASESDFEGKLKKIKDIDGVVIVSASGMKDAPRIARASKRYRKKIVLITNNPRSSIRKIAEKTYVFPKQREPYTYNTSTYMSMILGWTKEDPKKILRFLREEIGPIRLPGLGKYNKFYLIIPPEFSEMRRMLQVKFIELFGREMARDIETSEYVRHATTLVPSKDELFISFGKPDKTWGKNRVYVPLPKNAGYGSMMAIGYYIIGKIQKAHKPYFKNNLGSYVKKISNVFGEKIPAIVE